MKRCPITYEIIPADKNYSAKGLKLLAPKLQDIQVLALTAQEIRDACQMSIPGIQAKVGAILKINENRFAVANQNSAYILKPQSSSYAELPENEALTMTLASIIGIDTPLHGLIYGIDGNLTYFIKRFDRSSHKNKIAVEDFTQLSQASRDSKAASSMEKIASLIEEFCSFPKLEVIKLFKLTLFNFLCGNADMHLKNFSLITSDKKIFLAPIYDLLNTTIVQAKTKEEIALPLNGKKRHLTAEDLINYYGAQLHLNKKIISQVVHEIKHALPLWKALIKHSFLSEEMKIKYLNLLVERCQCLKL